MITSGSHSRFAATSQAWGGSTSADPYRGYNFAVEIEGLVVAGCVSVTGVEAQIQTDTYQEGGVNDHLHHLPRQTTFSNIELDRGLTLSPMLWQWFHQVSRGAVVRRNLTIVLLNDEATPQMWWNVRSALPVRWAGPDLHAMQGTVAFETIELVHDGIGVPQVSEAASVARSIVGGP